LDHHSFSITPLKRPRAQAEKEDRKEDRHRNPSSEVSLHELETAGHPHEHTTRAVNALSAILSVTDPNAQSESTRRVQLLLHSTMDDRSNSDTTVAVSVPDGLVTCHVHHLQLDLFAKERLNSTSVGLLVEGLLQAEVQVVLVLSVGNRTMAQVCDKRTKIVDVGEEQSEETRATDASEDASVNAESHRHVGRKDEEGTLRIGAQIFLAEVKAEEDPAVLVDFFRGEERSLGGVHALCCRNVSD
jgi:hypothetical protein